jgi:hypothetical protein
MRKIERAAVVLLSVYVGAAWSAPDRPSGWKLVDDVTYDWRGDSRPYEFAMSVPEDYHRGGDFTQLRILLRGREIFQLKDEDGLAKLKDEPFSHEILEASRQNLLNSEHLLMLPGLKGSSRYPVLMLFGWSYASSPGSFHVVVLDDHGVPREILGLTNFYLRSITDLDHDGVPELVGQKCLSQEWGPELLTYDPLLAYRFGATAASPVVLDKELSRKASEEQAYGWAGSECREDLAVVLHPPGGGKPRILPADEAEALLK